MCFDNTSATCICNTVATKGPFKGKGGIQDYLDRLQRTGSHLRQAQHDFTQRHNGFLKSFDLAFRIHVEYARRYRFFMIRWRRLSDRSIGNAHYDHLISRLQNEGDRMRVYEMECQRCLLNNQAGMLNGLIRRLNLTLESLEHAEGVLGPRR